MPSTNSLKNAWWRMPKPVRQTLVLMVGTAIIIAGIFMLIFPGPGWAAIFLGFAVLATEFAFAEKVRDWLVNFAKHCLEYAKRQWQKVRNKH